MDVDKFRERACERFYEQLEDTFFFQVHRMMRAFMKHGNQLLQTAKVPVHQEQFPVLFAVDAIDGISQKELADIIMRDKSSVQRSIAALERRGLLLVLPDEADKRKNRIHLTDAGKQIASQTRGLMRQADNSAFASFTVRERAVALAQIREIADKLEQNAGISGSE